jgi:hypothetical protein
MKAVPGTTSIFLHSKIPKGIVGDCNEEFPGSPTQNQKRKGEKEKGFKGGSVNADPCGGVRVYVCLDGRHNGTMVSGDMKFGR